LNVFEIISVTTFETLGEISEGLITAQFPALIAPISDSITS